MAICCVVGRFTQCIESVAAGRNRIRSAPASDCHAAGSSPPCESRSASPAATSELRTTCAHAARVPEASLFPPQ